MTIVLIVATTVSEPWTGITALTDATVASEPWTVPTALTCTADVTATAHLEAADMTTVLNEDVIIPVT